MKYLKKSTVKTIIDLAEACPPDREFTAEEIRAGMMGRLETDANVKAFNTFITNLGEEETAELTALVKLGRNYDHGPEEFNELVRSAYRERPRLLLEEPKQKLPQYLRLAMERMARAYSGKQIAKPKDEDQRHMLIGKFVKERYELTYGEHGWHKLVTLMEEAGYLDHAETRKLFGLPKEKKADELSTVLSGKRASARVRLGTIRED